MKKLILKSALVFVVCLTLLLFALPFNSASGDIGMSDWTIVFNPTGTHIQKGLLKVRLDFYPSVDSKSYISNYIDVINDETGEKTKKLTSALGVFVIVPSDITKEQLEDFVVRTYTPDFIATIDSVITEPNAVHFISPYMKDKLVVSKEIIDDAENKSAIINSVNDRLSGFSLLGSGTGVAQETLTESIDIGPGATDRGSAWSSGYTRIDLANPANATGILDSFQFWFNVNASGVVAGTFYGSGTNYTSRDYESIGSVTAGAVRTFAGLNCNVTTGDFFGVYYSGGDIEMNGSGGSGVYWKVNSQFGTGLQTYSLFANYVISIYATGVELVPPTVTTQAASTVGFTSATGNGNVTNLNSSGDATIRGFQWDIDSGAPYANDVHENGTFGTGTFSLSLSSLPTCTIIYYRAYATSPGGTGYGGELNFFTGPVPVADGNLIGIGVILK